MSTNTKLSEMDFDISQEPSVMSTDPKERKLARRIRIQRRLEAMKKQEGSEDEGTTEKTRTEKQIDASAELMQKLVTEGDEVVSNVRVANDAREIQRREEDIAIRKTLLQNLEEEAQDSMTKYEDINSKWSSILASKDPLDIHAAIQSQNAKCLEVLAQKDVIIGQLKHQLEEADNKFADDQKKQNEDINLLIERIDNQMNSIAKAYRHELALIEGTLTNERTALLESITKKWDALYKERQDNEIQGVERRREIMREYEKEMNRVLIEHQEQYRAQKIWLETECQKLQQDVQDMKALCLMNIEKLDYSYAVLKRREGENTIVKNQQTRRINKLQDVINDLKKTYTELEESTRLKIEKLQEQVNKAYKNIVELESKSNHFTFVNDRQYMQIWEMNSKNADKLVDQILTVDKIIYEQMLGLDWEPSEVALLKKEDLPSYREAMQIIEQKNTEQQEITKLYGPREKESSPERITLERKLLNHVLKQISEQTGFLIEEKMRELLASHTQKDQVIIRLDNVFQALNINSEEQVHLLIKFFLPYSYCPTCTNEKENIVIPLEEREQKHSIKEIAEDTICSYGTQDLDERAIRLVKEVMLHISLESENDNDDDDDESVSLSRDSAQMPLEPSIDTRGLLADGEVDESSSKPESGLEERILTCDKGHLLEIQSENVIKALREFVEKYNEAKRDEIPCQSKKFDEKVTLSRSITSQDMTEYWKRYREIFSSNKEKLWDALMIGLHKYHEILKERQKLMDETESIRRQNSELRRLLETCKVKSDTCSTQRATRSANRTV